MSLFDGQIGGEIKVVYDPNRPQRAVIQAGPTLQHEGIEREALISVGFLTAGVILASGGWDRATS